MAEVDDGKPPVPNLKLAQLRFQASHGNKEAAAELLEHIKEKSLSSNSIHFTFCFFLHCFVLLFRYGTSLYFTY